MRHDPANTTATPPRAGDVLAVACAADWRAWLADHGGRASEVWLVIPRARSSTPGIGYREAIEQALCFGWIDSQARKREAGSFQLRFSPRAPRSRWSRTNRERAARLIERGLMTDAGLAAIARAKAAGTWMTDGRDVRSA